MAGPTPVSALIHAATMVTAGVYLLARSSFLYANLPDVSYWIALVGLLTALYGALSAFGQWDIKRIVAYSTISQLGYMFLAAGVGAYWAALFHVLTHAFYKALLFLASGSVIHALGGEQDVRKMGGLKKYLPRTHLHGLIGALSLAGFPLLAGFWSKDAILSSTLTHPYGGLGFYLGGLFVAVLTALRHALVRPRLPRGIPRQEKAARGPAGDDHPQRRPRPRRRLCRVLGPAKAPLEPHRALPKALAL